MFYIYLVINCKIMGIILVCIGGYCIGLAVGMIIGREFTK